MIGRKLTAVRLDNSDREIIAELEEYFGFETLSEVLRFCLRQVGNEIKRGDTVFSRMRGSGTIIQQPTDLGCHKPMQD